MLHVVTDFDGTLMHQDVGDTLMHELGVMEQASTQEATRLFREKKIGSLEWIKAAYAHLEHRRADIDRILETVRPRDGALEFLQFCREEQIPVTILSDGMRYYIERLMDKFQIQVQQVIVNPITYKEDGSYSLGVQNKNESCSWCGCCKAEAVQSLKQAGHQVIYIGDGSSDFYGSGFADWVFARSSLAKHMDLVQDTYFPFETFHDVYRKLSWKLDEYRNGTAPGKRHVPNVFCSFDRDMKA